jgi:hypothetical protein
MIFFLQRKASTRKRSLLTSFAQCVALRLKLTAMFFGGVTPFGLSGVAVGDLSK